MQGSDLSRDSIDSQRRERLERRMQSEFESSRRILGDVVNEQLDVPYRLSAVRFEGTEVTRASFLGQLARPLLLSQRHGLRGILQTSKDLAQTLAHYNIFDNIETVLARSPSMLADENDLDLILRLRESSRLFLKAGTNVGNNEADATFTGRLRNVFGGAEVLQGQAAFGTKTKSSFQFLFETPLPTRPSPNTRLEFGISAAERDLSHYASCREHTRGGAIKLRTTSRLGLHEFAYELLDRHLSNYEPHASLSMRLAAGHNIKSALSHTLLAHFPDARSQIRCLLEYAGLAGDAHHLKMTGEATASRAFADLVSPLIQLEVSHNADAQLWTIATTVRTGLLFPLGEQPSVFSDRFHLGGVTSIRAFKHNSIGPKDNGDFLGGDLTWSAGLSAFHPIPWRKNWPVQMHAFLNAGRLVATQKAMAPLRNLAQLVHRPVASAGFGLAYSNGPVRLEVNFTLPLAGSLSDQTAKGFGVGLGLDFL